MNKEHCPTCGCEVTVEGKTTKYYKPVNQQLTAVAWDDMWLLELILNMEDGNINKKELISKIKQSTKAIDLDDFLKFMENCSYNSNTKLWQYVDSDCELPEYYNSETLIIKYENQKNNI